MALAMVSLSRSTGSKLVAPHSLSFFIEPQHIDFLCELACSVSIQTCCRTDTHSSARVSAARQPSIHPSQSAMIAEKQHSPRPSDVDAIRHEAIRMRLLSQEWAGDSLNELTQALVKLNTVPPNLPHHQYETYLSLILANLDKFTAAAHAASTFINVIAEEREQLSLHVAQADQAILEEQKQVQHLTQQLEREKRQVDRRAQYDALAKLIMEHPSCEKSQKELQDAQNDATAVAAQLENLEQTKGAVRKELLLLAHCTSELGESVNNLSSMISDQHKRPTHSPEPMDTSL